MSQSLLKAIKLLDCFKDKSEMTLYDLVEESNYPKTTVFRLVTSLEEAGLLVKVKRSSHDVRYRLGLKLLELGKRVSDQLEYRKIALPYMRKLNSKLNELVQMAVIEGDEAIYVEKLDSTKPVRLVIHVGGRSPLYAGSAPKLLLAYMNDEDREDYLQNITLEKMTENTIDNLEQLKQELDVIKQRGYSISKAEHYRDTMGFSYPIKDFYGETVAALGVSIPITDYSKAREEIILEETRKTAEEISRELGYRG
ncbi:IclR family transcriptional regulator [Salinibacillus aidingensis]|uniref:IclR family transcriptional regulator n=1 Tax=Salinibacillus aidingensis TaxID=237684 RepID=A0ABN1AWS3_9BACI